MTLNKFSSSTFGNIDEDLCSRQVIYIPFNEELFRGELLSPIERDLYDIIDISPVLSELTEQMSACTYNCSSSHMTVKKEYLAYIKRNKPDSIKVIVCGTEYSQDNIPSIIKDKITKQITLPRARHLIGDLHPFDLEYPIFEKPYHTSIKENGKLYYVLHTNIPHSYYSRIPLVDATFSYDINSKILYDDDYPIGSILSFDEMLESYKEDISNKEFPEINILINNNNITPLNIASDSTDIFVSKLLNIPYIPVNILLSDDGSIPFQILKKNTNPISLDETNRICNPYFILRE